MSPDAVALAVPLVGLALCVVLGGMVGILLMLEPKPMKDETEKLEALLWESQEEDRFRADMEKRDLEIAKSSASIDRIIADARRRDAHKRKERSK